MMEKTQEQARQEILDLVADYCETYHINKKKPYRDRATAFPMRPASMMQTRW